MKLLGFISVILVLVGCNALPDMDKNVEQIFGYWHHEKTEYSNATIVQTPTTVYFFKPVVVYVSNNLTNYSGEILDIQGFSTNSITNVWAFDAKNNKLYLMVGITNFIYSINLVAVDSTNINYIWLFEGVYRISNVTVGFFVSNNVRRYIFRKL
ncbi:MAG: hypothetical protein N2712_06285 [Brevinematales bacterium]|nr:hypothetical protein [Brevinematales bacterium]